MNNQIFLGPGLEDVEIKQICTSHQQAWKKFENFEDMASQVAKLIEQGKIIGWAQGRMEFGPRALGNRSILADPRNPEMQRKLNLKIKFRESFRPFAPAILEEALNDYFVMNVKSPFMLQVHQVKSQLEVPSEKCSTWKDQLCIARSSLPSITHVDGSARIQSVNRKNHPKFHFLISEFKKLTGVPVLINTSFNVRGEPIVCGPQEAYNCFLKTEMDYLVLDNYLFTKSASFKDGIIN